MFTQGTKENIYHQINLCLSKNSATVWYINTLFACNKLLLCVLLQLIRLNQAIMYLMVNLHSVKNVYTLSRVNSWSSLMSKLDGLETTNQFTHYEFVFPRRVYTSGSDAVVNILTNKQRNWVQKIDSWVSIEASRRYLRVISEWFH